MMWILIWVIWAGHGVTSGTKDFNTKQDCERAMQYMMTTSRYYNSQNIFCVPKGEV